MARILMLTALPAALLLAGAAQADVTLNYASAQRGPSKIQVSDGKVRMESADRQGGGEITLFDGTSQTMTILMPDKHQYIVMDEAAMERMGKAVGGMMAQAQAQMQQQLAQMPPAQRKQMEAQMAQMGMGPAGASASKPEPFSIKHTGRSDNAAGVDCEWLDVYHGAKMVDEVCIGAPDDAGVSSDDFGTLKNMFAFMSKMTRAMSAAGAGSRGDDTALAVQQGVPIIGRDKGTPYSKPDTTRLTQVDHGGIAAAQFQIPAGYQKIDPMAGMRRVQ